MGDASDPRPPGDPAAGRILRLRPRGYGVVNANLPSASLSVRWDGLAHDCPLVFSDGPEEIDAEVLKVAPSPDGPVCLYADKSGQLRGDVRVLLFHMNDLPSGDLRLGLTVRNASDAPARLRLYRRNQQMTARAKGYPAAAATGFMANWWRDNDWSFDEIQTLAAGACAIVAFGTIAPGEDFVYLGQLGLFDDMGRPAALDVVTWAQRVDGPAPTGEATLDAPLAPWSVPAAGAYKGNFSGKIRATLPHAEMAVDVTVPGGGSYFIDIDSNDCGADGRPAERQGEAPAWMTNAYVNEPSEPWPYAADPLGFVDRTKAAAEYLPGYDWVDAHAEGDGDPTRTGYVRVSRRYRDRDGAWASQRTYNYGEFGVDVSVRVTSRNGKPFLLAATAAVDGEEGRMVAWLDPATGRVGALPPSLGMGQAVVLADDSTSAAVVTSVPPGGYAPIRLVVAPAGDPGSA